MKITLTSGKDFKKTKTFLKRCKKLDLEDVLNIYAQAGLDALRANTHATGGGGYVYGIDFINPALDETFKYIADAAWKEVMGNERGR